MNGEPGSRDRLGSRIGLAPRVVVMAVAAVGITAAGASFLAYRELHRSLVRYEFKALGTLADLEEIRIQGGVATASSVATVLADDDEVGVLLRASEHGGTGPAARESRAYGVEELGHHFLEALSNHPEYRELVLARSPGGEEVFRAERGPGGRPRIAAPRTTDEPPEATEHGGGYGPAVLASAVVRGPGGVERGTVRVVVGIGELVSGLSVTLTSDHGIDLADPDGRCLVRFDGGRSDPVPIAPGERLGDKYPVLQESIRQGDEEAHDLQPSDDEWAGELVAYRRIAPDENGSQDLLLVVSRSDAPLRRSGAKLRNRILLTTTVGLGLLIPAVAWLAMRSVRPLRTMTKAAERVGKGEPPGILPTTAGGEVGALASSIRDMATEVRARTAALETEVERRRLVEEALRETHESLSMALAISRAMSWEWDFATGTGHFSEDYAEYFGLPRGSVHGDATAMFSVVHPDDREWVMEASGNAVESREPLRMEFRGATPDERWYVSHSRILPGPSPGASRMIGITWEITDRKRNERALRESQERYRRLVDVLPLALLVHRDGKVVFANPAAADVFRVPSPDALLGVPVLELVHPDERDQVRERVRKAMEESRAAPLTEERLLRRDGTEFPAEVAGVSFPDAGVPTMLVVARDLSERKRSEAERERIEQRLRDTQKLESLGVLAGGIAHDFNNILTGILGNVTLARERRSNTAALDGYLGSIEESTARAADLCRQMLAYSGRGRFVVGPVDLSALVRETLPLVELSVSKRARMEVALGEGLPPVEADGVQLRQILMNLVINASDALGERGGHIRVSTGLQTVGDVVLEGLEFGTQLSAGPHVFLEVRDDGEGMDMASVARIFEPFFTTKFTGRGLGLSAVLGIVKGHNGAIRVHSEPGRGTAFRLLLPPARSERGVAVAEGAAPDSEWRPGGHVLVVDDEDAVRRVTSDMLRALGFQVVEARDGLEGLDVYLRDPHGFRFVVLDLTMPRMDGAEVFGRMREVRGDLRAILMSGFSEEELRDRFARDDVAGYLQKPFGLHELKSCLGAVLGREGLQGDDA